MQNTLTDGKLSGASDAQLCGWQFDMQGAFERVPEFPQLLPSGNTQASDHENHSGLDFDKKFSSPDLCAGIKTQWLLTFPTIMIWCLEFSPRLFWSPRFSCKPHLSIYHGICCTTRKWNTKVKIYSRCHWVCDFGYDIKLWYYDIFWHIHDIYIII